MHMFKKNKWMGSAKHPKKIIKRKEFTTTTTVPSSKTTIFGTNSYINIFGKTTRHTAQKMTPRIIIAIATRQYLIISNLK